jgi:hypothetical protein
MSYVSDKGVTVPAYSLDTILSGRKPKLALMDVEGYEHTLLPVLAPRFAKMGTVLVAALHERLPDPEWFKDFRYVVVPAVPMDRDGRSFALVARP